MKLKKKFFFSIFSSRNILTTSRRFCFIFWVPTWACEIWFFHAFFFGSFGSSAIFKHLKLFLLLRECNHVSFLWLPSFRHLINFPNLTISPEVFFFYFATLFEETLEIPRRTKLVFCKWLPNQFQCCETGRREPFKFWLKNRRVKGLHELSWLHLWIRLSRVKAKLFSA